MTDEAVEPLIDIEHRSTLINRVLAEIEARYVFRHVGANMAEAMIAVPQEEALLTAHREALKGVLASLTGECDGPVHALSEEVRDALETLQAGAAH